MQSDSKPWTEITCPEVACTAVLEHGDFQRHASAAVFERYDRHLTRQFLQEDPNLRECAYPGCDNGGITDPERDTFLMCDACSQKTGLECNTVYHVGISCMQNQGLTDTGAGSSSTSEKRREELRNEELASLKAANELAGACPGTSRGALIEKNGGGDHMTCQAASHFKLLALADL